MKTYIPFFLLLTLIATSCGRYIDPNDYSYRPKKHELIVVDAGHGGKDPGCTSKKDRYEEKELTLSTAHILKNALEQLGYTVVLTRHHDTYLPLDTRAEIANAIGADLFVSIHYNYSPNQEARGAEVYSYKEGKTPPSKRIASSKQLAQHVIKGIEEQTKAPSRGLKEANFCVIRETKMPAILVEGGFLSNPQEREKLRDPQYRTRLAWAIAQGVDTYLNYSSISFR
ncbi:MAG: N-acetylmuramoyl-L-alanine amidase AmiC [Chlamydiae bacterium]|nr:N-acetylmuramoyl-L-alanine amidase AmiC [Chlamydiota bacterium]